MSEQKNELRQIITDALVSMVSGVTGLVPPSGPGQIPDFIQAPIDRAVERISASLPVGVPDGYALVPVEPTPEMIAAVVKYDREVMHTTWVGTWREYLAAALAAPTVKAEQARCEECGGNGAGGDHEDDCSKASSIPAAGLSVEDVKVVGHLSHCVDGYDPDAPPPPPQEPLMTVAQHQRIVATLSAQQSAPERVSVPDVKRWSVGWGGGSEVVEEVHPQGDYVRWEDYAALCALLASHGRGEA